MYIREKISQAMPDSICTGVGQCLTQGCSMLSEVGLIAVGQCLTVGRCLTCITFADWSGDA